MVRCETRGTRDGDNAQYISNNVQYNSIKTTIGTNEVPQACRLSDAARTAGHGCSAVFFIFPGSCFCVDQLFVFSYTGLGNIICSSRSGSLDYYKHVTRIFSGKFINPVRYSKFQGLHAKTLR